jgi:hypothetical protein
VCVCVCMYVNIFTLYCYLIVGYFNQFSYETFTTVLLNIDENLNIFFLKKIGTIRSIRCCFGATTFSIMALSIRALCITKHTIYAERCYAKCLSPLSQLG